MDLCISTIICLIFSPILLIIIRALYLIFKIHTSDCRLVCENSLRTILCIGSGGHTMELMRLVKNLNFDKYQHRLYVLADNDFSSKVKIHEIEDGNTDYALNQIPRSRNVSQSYLSSVFSTVYATLFCVPIVFNFKPNVIFCNGPGTCIPICLVAFFLRCMFIIDCRIVFIESICRIRTLSLSGKILQFIADIFIVQWPQLRDVCYRAKYFGRLT